MVFRALPRERIWNQSTVAGKTVVTAAVQVPMSGFNEAEIDLAELLANASVIAL